LHIGSIFYWKHKGWGDLDIMDEAKEAHFWTRELYCTFHKKNVSECGCINYFQTIKRGEFDVRLNVLLNNETFLPQKLIFEIDLVGDEGPMKLTSYGDSKEVSNEQNFKEVIGNFIIQADEIIARHGIPGTGWVNNGICF